MVECPLDILGLLIFIKEEEKEKGRDREREERRKGGGKEMREREEKWGEKKEKEEKEEEVKRERKRKNETSLFLLSVNFHIEKKNYSLHHFRKLYPVYTLTWIIYFLYWGYTKIIVYKYYKSPQILLKRDVRPFSSFRIKGLDLLKSMYHLVISSRPYFVTNKVFLFRKTLFVFSDLNIDTEENITVVYTLYLTKEMMFLSKRYDLPSSDSYVKIIDRTLV